jgi:hypothetical protein
LRGGYVNIAANKRKGYSFEVETCDFLRDDYPDVERNGNRYGPNDRGDIANVGDWTLQCKNTKTDKWFEWFTATASQSQLNRTRWWAVVRKARNRNIRESLFVMPFHKGKELMAHLRDLESENESLKARIKELEQ